MPSSVERSTHMRSASLRPARSDDADFILALVPRFVAFELPEWRDRDRAAQGIHDFLAHTLANPPASSWLFVAVDDTGERVGFLHLQESVDFFTARRTCHISDLATAPGSEGRGIARQLLDCSEQWAAEHDCALVTLSVFPGNERAVRLYRRNGYATDMLRMAKPVTS